MNPNYQKNFNRRTSNPIRHNFQEFDMMNMMENFDDDPFDRMMFGDFGFPRLGQGNEENDIFGNMHRQMQGMMSNFGNMQQRISQMSMGGANPGTMITKSYVSRVNYNNGQPEQESYQSQSIQQYGKDGHKIHEKQEAYKNSRTGVEKASHQRLLDDRGQKMIKKRNRITGEKEEHNIFKGMEEKDVESFNQQYNDYRQKVGFQKNYQFLNNTNNRMNRLGDERRNPGNYYQRNEPIRALPSGNDNNNNHHQQNQRGNQIYNLPSNSYNPQKNQRNIGNNRTPYYQFKKTDTNY